MTADRDEARLRKQTERDVRIRAIYRLHPELRRLDEDLADAGREGLRRVWEGGATEEAKARILRLSQEKTQMLRSLGLSEEIYDIHWDCPLCQDKGYVNPGEPCSCRFQEDWDRLGVNSGLTLLQSKMGFDTFSLAWYDRPDEVSRIVGWMKAFADDLIRGETCGNLFLVGPVGNGKTHLCCAVANRLLAAGKTVFYTRTEELLEALREDIYGRGDYQGAWERQDGGERQGGGALGMGALQRALIHADLLIMEDLGTERLTDFAEERIISLVDQRINWQKPWLITSHLVDDRFTGRYDQRLVDRILGEGRLLYLNEGSVRFKKTRR